jgi:DNA recombination protein RmuC
MSAVAWLALGAAAIVLIAAIAIVVWTAGRRSTEQLSAVRQEMQNSMALQGQSVAGQINHLMQAVTTQLGQVRQELQSGVASSGKLASDAQIAMAHQLQASSETIRKMSVQLGEVQQAGRDMSQATQTLQTILGGAKTRGTLGEVALERLLEDALPRSAYSTQHRFASTGAIVDAIVRSGERLLSVDSKFPLEAYRRLVETGDDARREFCVAVRKHADCIAEKYILPDEHTFDYALMFVPSESVYYELLLTEDSKYGMLDEYCRSKRVFPVSPNTFYACLNAFAISLQGQKIEERTRHILAGMSGLKKQFESCADVFERLGTHLRHAQQSYEEADSKLSRAGNSLEQLEQGALSEAEQRSLSETEQKALEPASEQARFSL